MSTTTKILVSVAGAIALGLLVLNVAGASKSSPVVENWTNVALRPNMHTVSYSKSGGKSLLSDLPDSVFFQPTPSMQPKTVIGATNMMANSIGSAGPRMALAGPGLGVQAGLNSTPFENFEQAANIAEHYTSHGSHKGGHMHQKSSPAGCGPAGTIAAGYGRSNLVGADFDALSGPNGQSKDSMLESSGTSFTSELPVASMDGNVGAAFMTDRMVYSTLQRARCPGTVDMIRGDLAITPCGQYMQTSARPADSLSTGAMAAMFGIGNGSGGANDTIRLVSMDAANGGLSALSGMNVTDLVEQGAPPSSVNASTFASTSANMVADAYANLNQSGSRMAGANPTNGDVAGMSSPAALYTGYTSFA